MGSLQITPICSMNNKVRKFLFVIFSMLAILAALYHSLCIFAYYSNTDLYIFGTDRSPLWRHALFICICIICMYGLLKRPLWFVWFFGVLTLQQLYSHGSHFINLLQEHKINWVDAVVVVLTPLVFILLLADRKTIR